MGTFIKWIITIYIVSILAWSGLLRAEEIVINQASYDQNNFELLISGLAYNQCGLSLKTRIIENQFTEEGPVALLEIINRPNVQACPMGGKEQPFDLMIDVRSLGLKPGATYGLTFANSFEAHGAPIYTVEIPSNSFFPDYHPSFASGVLSKNRQGDWVLVQGFREFLTLKSKIDLSKYLGQFVTIEGIEIQHRTGPIFDNEEHLPLQSADSRSEGPTMFLFSISTTSY